MLLALRSKKRIDMNDFHVSNGVIFNKSKRLTLEEAVMFMNEGELAVKILFRLDKRRYIFTNDPNSEQDCNYFAELAHDLIKRYQKLV